MSARPVTIVDYGLGNLHSVARAVRASGGEPVLTREPEALASAERVILPGVGAFGDGMKGLRERGLLEPLRAFAASGKPFLGICLGMQLLLDESEEFGTHPGLGLIPGKVAKLDARDENGAPLKLPHIGWSGLTAPEGRWSGTVLSGLGAETEVYFVHSFAPVAEKPEHVLALCRYGRESFTAALRKDNITGCQFHPEKSGSAGLKILSTFIKD